MKNSFALIYFVMILLLCPVFSGAQSNTKHPDYEKRLTELGIHLTIPKKPTANFVRTRRVGNLVFLSGHGPDKPEGGRVVGKLGKDLTIEQGQEAARLACISLLSSLRAEIGNLNKVKKIVSVLGMVNADPSFDQHSKVINGCSDLLVEIFGENGKHVRSAVGMSSLAFNQAVEIEMVVELK
jgi:enamine deaminase RidA (YjgF/YER057c/UK114 family)